MEEGNSKSMVIAIVAVLVLIGGGLGIYALTQDDESTDTTTSEVSQQDASEPAAEAEAQPNVVEAAIATPDLSTLVAAVTEADLVDTLSGEGPFTVFAPTNDAFASAIEELDTTAEDLLAREDLGAILTYHVVAGEVFAADLSDGQVIETVQGDELTVRISDGKVMLEDTAGRMAEVITPDVDVSNGVVHIINNVVLPQL